MKFAVYLKGCSACRSDLFYIFYFYITQLCIFLHLTLQATLGTIQSAEEVREVGFYHNCVCCFHVSLVLSAWMFYLI